MTTNMKALSAKLLDSLYGGSNDRALSAVASALAGATRNVKVDGAASTGSTDGKSTTLPTMEVMNKVCPGYGLDAARGMLDHEELGHGRFTDFRIRPTADLRGALLNIIEDARVEASAMREFPGCKRHLDALHAWDAPNAIHALEKATGAGAVRVAARVALGIWTLNGKQQVSRAVQQCLDILEKHKASLRASFASMQNTQAAKVLADNLFDIVKAGLEQEEQREREQKRQNQKSQQSQQSQQSEAGQGESSESQEDSEGEGEAQDGEGGEAQEGDQKPSKGGMSGKSGKASGKGDGQSGVPDTDVHSTDMVSDAAGQTGGQSAADALKQALQDAEAKACAYSEMEKRIRNMMTDALQPSNLILKECKIKQMDADLAKSTVSDQLIPGYIKSAMSQSAKTRWTNYGTSYSERRLADAKQTMRPMVGKLRGGLQNALRRRGMADPRFGLRRGQIDPVMLPLGAAGITGRFFQQDDSEPGQAALRIVLCCDVSRSMQRKLDGMALTVAALGEALNGMPNLTFGMLGFDTSAFITKDFNERWGAPQLLRKQSACIAANSGTTVETGMRLALGMLAAERGKGGREAIFIITDGETSRKEPTRRLVNYARKNGIEVFALGLESPGCLEWMEPAHCAFGMTANLDQVLLDMVGKLILSADI